MTYATISQAPGAALPAAVLSDALFEALVTAVEVAATEADQADASATIGIDAAPTWEWTPSVDSTTSQRSVLELSQVRGDFQKILEQDET